VREKTRGGGKKERGRRKEEETTSRKEGKASKEGRKDGRVGRMDDNTDGRGGNVRRGDVRDGVTQGQRETHAEKRGEENRGTRKK
jgi:hypothetical protein